MGRFGALDADRLKGKFRFRAIVRKVIINLAWLTEPEEVEEELEEGERLDKAMLRAKSRRRREGGQMLTLEEKLLFNIPPAVRTDEEVQKGLKVIQRMRQFARFPEEVQLGLAKTLYFLYLKANRMILKEGHEAEAMYFVLQGDVLISVERTDPYTHEPVHQHLAILTGGDMFGEVALLYDIPRTASVTSSSVVELLGMNKDDFASVLQRTLEAQWQRFRREIARFSYFDNYGETQIREMCILGRMRSFVKDETILGDGQGSVEYAYFLLSGHCRLIQTITVEVWEEFGDTVFRLLDDPTLVAVRRLAGGHGGARGAAGGGQRASASVSTLAQVVPEQLAAQDEWRLASMRLDAAIGCPPHSPQWRAARQEVQRVLKKEEPFKYKAIVHPEDWDRARHKVIETLGEHTVRGAKRSRSTEQLHKLFGRSSTGAPPSPAARRMSMLPGVTGRHTKLPPFVGTPSDFLGLHDGDDGASAQSRPSQPHTYGKHAEAIRSLAGSVVLPRDSLRGALGAAAAKAAARAAEGSRGKGSHEGLSGQEPLQLELVRGRRPKGSPTAKGSDGQRGSGASVGSKGSFAKGFATDSERHAVIKMRHEFEDPFERTPRARRMSLISRGSIRNAWANGVRAVAEVMVRCEEAGAGAGAGAEAGAAEAREEKLRQAWGRACRGVERFMKKEQVPVMRPRHRISCHFVQVCFYTPLQVFGIGESMEQRRVTATSAAECMLLPRYWLDQNNVANVWERVRLYLNRSVPDTRAVFRAWAAERRWLRHRQAVVKELIDRRALDSETTPYDVPYSLRLHEIASPYE